MKKYAKKRCLSSLLAMTMLMSSMSYNNVTIFADDVAEDADVVVSGEAVAVDADAEAAETMVEDYLEVVGDTTNYGTVTDLGTGSVFLGDAGFEADDVIFENDYATVYASQKLKFDASANDLISLGRDPEELTFDGVTFQYKLQTNSVNTTVASQTTPVTDPATNGGTFKLSSTQRIAYKVVTKQACKITAYAAGGNHFLWLDDGGAANPSVTVGNGTAKTPATGSGSILGGISGTGAISADVDAGQLVFFSGQGTNDNFLGIRVEKGSEVINPAVKLTLDGEAITAPVNVTGAGFKYDGASATEADGTFKFNGLATYDYTLTVAKDGVTYQGVFKANADGTYEPTLDLKVIAADTNLTVTDASGAPLAGVDVILDHVVGYTPVKETATTDENGVAKFNLTFDDYNVQVPGYDLDKTVYSPKQGALTDTVKATPSNLPEIPADLASKENALFVGFAAKDGVKSYSFVQDAVKDAVDGGAVYVASGKYYEMVTIDKSLDIIGVGSEKPVITYNDNQQGNDDNGKTRFHGDTLSVAAAAATVNLENLVIENNSEETIPGVVQNATALSSCYNASSNIINVKDCDIVATRDTVYTGKSNCTDQWTFTNSSIYGFQDVVCGGGNVDLIDCTWVLNMDSDARLLVPQCRDDGVITTMTATNLTVKTADKFVAKLTGGLTDASWNSNAYLGRPWGNSSAPAATTQAIVYNLIDEAGLVKTGTTTNGYDPDNGLSASGGISSADWLLGVDPENDVFVTTKWQDVNKYDAALSGNTVRGSYQIVGAFNEAIKDEIDGVGFAIYDENNNYVGTALNKSAYNIKGSDDKTAYAVAYINNAPAKFKVKSAAVVDGKTYIYNSNNATVTAG